MHRDNVAIQLETQRQRQIEFLQATNYKVDMLIMGIKGRAAVLRPVANTIGLNGEEVVPSEDQLEKMEQQQKDQGPGGGAIQAEVERGVQAGVKAGVQRIATELTAGALAQRAHLPEGNPTHIGTLPATSNPQMDLSQAAAHAQGTQPSRLAAGGLSPQVANLVGNQRGPGALPISPGVG